MSQLRPIVALVLLLAVLPSGAALLAACFADAPHRCCCDGDCPDDQVSVSRTMPCCKPGQAPPVPADPLPVLRVVEHDGMAATAAGDLVAASPVVDPEHVTADASEVRPVPLFRLHAALLI